MSLALCASVYKDNIDHDISGIFVCVYVHLKTKKSELYKTNYKKKHNIVFYELLS